MNKWIRQPISSPCGEKLQQSTIIWMRTKITPYSAVKMEKLKNTPALCSVHTFASSSSSSLNKRRANKTVLIICYFFTAHWDNCRPHFFSDHINLRPSSEPTRQEMNDSVTGLAVNRRIVPIRYSAARIKCDIDREHKLYDTYERSAVVERWMDKWSEAPNLIIT